MSRKNTLEAGVKSPFGPFQNNMLHFSISAPCTSTTITNDSNSDFTQWQQKIQTKEYYKYKDMSSKEIQTQEKYKYKDISNKEIQTKENYKYKDTSSKEIQTKENYKSKDTSSKEIQTQ